MMFFIFGICVVSPSARYFVQAFFNFVLASSFLWSELLHYSILQQVRFSIYGLSNVADPFSRNMSNVE